MSVVLELMRAIFHCYLLTVTNCNVGMSSLAMALNHCNVNCVGTHELKLSCVMATTGNVGGVAAGEEEVGGGGGGFTGCGIKSL